MVIAGCRRQILDEPERLHEQPSAETIVVVQWFCRRCWSLGVRYEFALCNADSFVDGMDRLAEQVGPPYSVSHPPSSRAIWSHHPPIHTTLSSSP